MNLKFTLLLWLPMILIAFANAGIRELFLSKNFNSLPAHQISSISLILFCSIYVYFIFNLLGIKTSLQALVVGLIWMVLTMLFEIGIGLVTKKTWNAILQDYNLLAGHLWPLFLLSLFFMPYLIFRFVK